MKTRRNPDRRCLLLAALALAAAPLHAQPDSKTLDLEALAALLAQRKAAEARFVEDRHVSGFEQPLRSSGTLSYTAPDRFERRTLQPRPETMRVEGNTLTLERAGRKRTMTVDSVPELTALIEAVRATFGGDAATLRKHFATRVEGTASLWTLTLVPREGRLASQVRELQIAGSGSDMRSVALWLAGGDRSVMAIESLR